MSRILLIRTALPTLDNKVTQPLGIMYIAASLLRDHDNEVRILDLKLKPLSLYEIIYEVQKFNPDIIGFSVLPLESSNFKFLSLKIKKNFPKIIIIVGGVYPTVLPYDVFYDSAVDFTITGEGEKSMYSLVKALKSGKSITKISGISFFKNGILIINKKKEYIKNLDHLPMPSWNLIDITGYFNKPRTFPIYENKEYMSILTSRACPYKCNFCHNIFGKEFRASSPESVISEIEKLYYTYGIKEIHIIDDCFNYDLNRAKKICDLIIKSAVKISITFPNGIRGDRVDEDFIYKLKTAGTYAICYGVQSGSQRIQTMSRSNINLKKLSKTVTLTDKMGIIAYGYCMIGFPGETKKELKMTLNYVMTNKFHGATFFFVTPFPGTDISIKFTNGKTGFNKNDFLKDYRFSPTATDNLSYYDLRKFQFFANISIYFNIKRLIRLISLIPNKKIFIEILKSYFFRFFIFSRKMKKTIN